MYRNFRMILFYSDSDSISLPQQSEFQFSGSLKRFQTGNHRLPFEWSKRLILHGKVARFFSISTKETEQRLPPNPEMLLPRSG